MRTPLVIIVASLTLVTAAAAANSTSFADRVGDADAAPDVSQVAVSSDDAGKVTVRVDVGNWPALLMDDAVAILLDVDQNPDTGSVYLGAEYVAEINADGVEFWRADGEFFSRTAPPASFAAAFSKGAATFSFAASDLDITAGFNVGAVTRDIAGYFTDPAPDYGSFNYQLVAGAAPPPFGADTRAPYVFAEKSKAVHGKAAHLDYEVADGRSETRERIEVYRGAKRLASIAYTLGDASPFYTYYATWKVPKTVRGTLKFCVRSYDRAGNASIRSCAPLVVT
jgi:hypothetical protein